MNRTKPSSVVGGGEMNRVTSSVVSRASSEAASLTRSSRSVMPLPFSTGTTSLQSELTVFVGVQLTVMIEAVMPSVVVVGMCVAITAPLPCGRRSSGRERSTPCPRRSHHSTEEQCQAASCCPTRCCRRRGRCPRQCCRLRWCCPRRCCRRRGCPRRCCRHRGCPTRCCRRRGCPTRCCRRRGCPIRCCRRRGCPTRCCRRRGCPRQCCRRRWSCPR